MLRALIPAALVLAFLLPPASATELPAPQPPSLPVCVPPGTLNGACVGFIDGNPCAWYWLGANFSSVCVVPGPSIQVCSNHLFGPGFECVPPVLEIAVDDTCDQDLGFGVCVQPNAPDGACVTAFFGLQGARACLGPEGVKVCTSLFVVGLGNCLPAVNCGSTLSLPGTATCTVGGQGAQCTGPFVGAVYVVMHCGLVGFNCFAVEWGLHEDDFTLGGSGCSGTVGVHPTTIYQE